MAFVGANPILSAILTRWEINIAVEWQGQCWDWVESHEAGAVRSASGYFCTLCVPEARVLYPSREALWRDHLFETFLEWANDKLLKARWIGIYGSPEIGVTWVKVLTDRPEHERVEHEKRGSCAAVERCDISQVKQHRSWRKHFRIPVQQRRADAAVLLVGRPRSAPVGLGRIAI